MKKDIHPKYVTTHVKCACGNEFDVESTQSNMSVETCPKCHPVFTGKTGKVQVDGRAERFNKKFGLTKEAE